MMCRFFWTLSLYFFTAAIIHSEDIPTVPSNLVPEATQPISFEWIYKESDQINRGLPRNVSWSPEGHSLAYLVSQATEEPDLLLFDPIKNVTQALLTPQVLGKMIDTYETGGNVDSTSQEEKEHAKVRIHSFKWLEKPQQLRLSTSRGTYLFDFTEKSIDKIQLPPGEKNHLTYSPDGAFIAYTRHYDLYAYDFEQRREIRLTHGGHERLRNGQLDWVYPEELDIRRGFYWSPDNRSIAYLQMNEEGVSSYPLTDFSPQVPSHRNQIYPKAGTKNPDVRVGVVSLSSQQTTWIDLGYPYEYIARVVWSPQGDFLAIQAMTRGQDRLALLFADPKSGTSKMVLEETDPYWINVQDGPFWLNDEGDFLWLSERDGFRHIYRYTSQGTLVKQLTQGNWEVTRIAKVIPEKKALFFEATKQSPIERQAYHISIRGGRIQPITQEQGTHSISISSDGKFVYDRFTSGTLPTRRTVLSKQGKRIRVLGEKTVHDYIPYRIQLPTFFTFEKENRQYHARMYFPPRFDARKKYPVIVSVYGGPHGQVIRDTFDAGNNQVWAAHGFLVFSMDNRGSWGYGHNWETPIYRHFGETELHDLLLGIEYLKSLPYVDPNRLGMWGWSFGGYFTCFAMCKAPGVFRAGAAVAPVTNWKLYDTIYTERYMDHPDENPDGYHNSSPIHFADQLKGALFLAHGTGDDNVHVQNSYQLIEALLKADKDYHFFAYPQKTHGIWGEEYRIHLFHRMLNFFKRELGQD